MSPLPLTRIIKLCSSEGFARVCAAIDTWHKSNPSLSHNVTISHNDLHCFRVRAHVIIYLVGIRVVQISGSYFFNIPLFRMATARSQYFTQRITRSLSKAHSVCLTDVGTTRLCSHEGASDDSDSVPQLSIPKGRNWRVKRKHDKIEREEQNQHPAAVHIHSNTRLTKHTHTSTSQVSSSEETQSLPAAARWFPEHWKEHVDNIREMRKERSAPVDSMGAEELADKSAPPKVIH